MYLTPSQVSRFYGIWFALLRFANTKVKVVDQCLLLGRSIQPKDAWPVRDALWSDDDLLKQFLRENPENLAKDELALAASWRWRVSGSFIVLKHLKKHSVFLSCSSAESGEPRAYGVIGLKSPLDEMILQMPLMLDAVLLPFEGKIIYDGLLATYSVSFGRSIRDSLNRDYQDLKKREMLIERLDRHALMLVR